MCEPLSKRCIRVNPWSHITSFRGQWLCGSPPARTMRQAVCCRPWIPDSGSPCRAAAPPACLCPGGDTPLSVRTQPQSVPRNNKTVARAWGDTANSQGSPDDSLSSASSSSRMPVVRCRNSGTSAWRLRHERGSSQTACGRYVALSDSPARPLYSGSRSHPVIARPR